MVTKHIFQQKPSCDIFKSMLDIEMRMSKYLSGVRSPNMKNVLCMGVLIKCDDYKKKRRYMKNRQNFLAM